MNVPVTVPVSLAKKLLMKSRLIFFTISFSKCVALSSYQSSNAAGSLNVSSESTLLYSWAFALALAALPSVPFAHQAYVSLLVYIHRK